mmetsp:Transcript_15683/g.19122  ORF Transcript_15683/g.19122 Transcript_15683/m.19122 type:complete len:95 (+) Transcript_15683:58-342(+)
MSNSSAQSQLNKSSSRPTIPDSPTSLRIEARLALQLLPEAPAVPRTPIINLSAADLHSRILFFTSGEIIGVLMESTLPSILEVIVQVMLNVVFR